jgi:hypothetical protein
MPPRPDGFVLYYASRRQNLASLRALIDFLVANQKSAVGRCNAIDKRKITRERRMKKVKRNKKVKRAKKVKKSEPRSDL